MIIKKRRIIQICCTYILILLFCSSCNKPNLSAEEQAVSKFDAQNLLLDYLYPETDYFVITENTENTESTEIIENVEVIEKVEIIDEIEITEELDITEEIEKTGNTKITGRTKTTGERNYNEYKFSLPSDGKNHVRRLVYNGLSGNYHHFELYTDNYSHDFYGNYGYTDSDFTSGFAVHKITGGILQERYEDERGRWVYSGKYRALLAQEEDGTLATPVSLDEDDSKNAVLSGTDRNGEEFHIYLDYHKQDVIVHDSYYLDLTADGNAELCIELNIQNSTASDMNTILVYDIGSRKVLFPNERKPLIYDGDTVVLGEDTVILYRGFDKINGVGIEAENSVVQWNGSSFDTGDYYRKLLLKNDEYAIFYENTEVFSQDNELQLTVLDSNSLVAIQEIRIGLDKETDIFKTIHQETLLVPDSTAGGATDDYYIEGYGLLHWNREAKSFETVPQLPGNEEVERIYYGDGLGFSYSPNSSGMYSPDTFLCYPDYRGDREQFTKEYLQARGTNQAEPDGVNERNGKHCSEYYIDEEKQRYSFIFYKNWNDDSLDETGKHYQSCIYYVTADRERMEPVGYLASGYDENGELSYQRSYDGDGGLEGYRSYENDINIPFPVITEHKEYVDNPMIGMNSAYYLEFYKADMDFDETGRWSGYRSCFLCGRDVVHNNVCVYNAQGKLEAIREPLLDEDREQDYSQEYSAELYVKYNGAGSPISSGYWGSNLNHRIGRGITGDFEYDDKGRIVSWSFLNGDIFFVYEGDSRRPWARITIGGNPYSSDGYEDGISYGHNTEIYLFLADS